MGKPNVNIIYRMPNLKEIRPIQFGKSISIIITFIAIGFFHDILFNGWMYLLFIPIWLLTGLLFGWGTGYLYNMFLSWSVKLVFRFRKRKNVLFGYQPGKKLQIIKSTIPDEEVKIPAEFEERKIYSTEITPIPGCPFTIAFIASPCYMNSEGKPLFDPILNEERFFYSSVGRALISLANDEVIGHPDIWSRIRILTIFPEEQEGEPNGEYAFVGESSFVYGESLLEGADDIISPISHLDKYFKSGVEIPEEEFKTFRDNLAEKLVPILEGENEEKIKKLFNEIDVIYFLTANEEYIRSSARPSEGERDTSNAKEYKINNETDPRHHEELAQIPGMVGLNVLYARQKTFIHEFAHAMAHDNNGAICDEYFDIDNESQIFTINSIRKTGGQIYVPKEFLEYHPSGKNKIIYHSDRDHPSTKENWHQYFPLREAKYIGCTMDRTIGDYQFDKLLSAFMYDRLITKVTR